MYDAHYDLLTYLYFKMNKNNKYKDVDKLIKDISKIYNNNNILGGIVNLYFMSKKEMLDLLDIKKDELKDITIMLKESINNLNYMKKINVIPEDIDFIYSIEGCDYIKNIKELEELYKLGIRSILPVWNNKNKYGSGIRYNKNLTKKGIKLIKKAIDLNMIIDLSHTCEKTYFDIINLVEKERKNNKEIFIMASHSNSKTICNVKRNLTDEQIIKLNTLGGYIGIVLHKDFLSNDNDKEKGLINQIIYIKDILKFNPNKILISTDNMDFNTDSSRHNLTLYNINNINAYLRKLLEKYFDKEFIDNILVNNMKNLISKVKII